MEVCGLEFCLPVWEGKGVCLLLRSAKRNLLHVQAPGYVSNLIWVSAQSLFVVTANEKVSEWQVMKGSKSSKCR